MNRPPEILVDSGFSVDQNGALTGLIVPRTVLTLDIPRSVTTYTDTINWIPSNAATLVYFRAPNLTALGNKGLFRNYINLTSVVLDNCISIGGAKGVSYAYGNFQGCTSLVNLSLSKCKSIINYTQNPDSGEFYRCTSLETLDLPECEEIYSGENNARPIAVFGNCTSLTTINAPKLKFISGVHDGGNNGYYGAFYNCTALNTINFPSLQSITWRCFSGCTGLTDVTLGSVGNPVTAINADAFYGCTQSGLTITVYTEGGAALSGEPWGATNADIEYEEA